MPTPKKRGPKPFSTYEKPGLAADRSKSPHKHARRLPPIERAAFEEFPLVYRPPNKHPRGEQLCCEVPLVAAPETMIAVRFADGARLIVLRRDVYELDASAVAEAGTEPDRKFWGTR